MSGHELHELYLEGKAGSRMNNLIFLLDQACNYDQKKAEAILEECQAKGYKLRPVYPGLGEHPEPEAIFVGAITDGGLYIIQ